MRPLRLSILLLLTSSLVAQNGAKAVAAKALKVQPLPCDKNAATGPACHKNYAAGCALPKDPKHKGKFAPPDLSYSPRYDAYLAYFKNQIPTVLPNRPAVTGSLGVSTACWVSPPPSPGPSGSCSPWPWRWSWCAGGRAWAGPAA